MSKEELQQAFYDITNSAVKLLNENVELKKKIETLDRDYKKIREELFEQYDRLDECWKREEKAIKYIETNSLYEQDYDYDYEENLVECPPSDEQAKKDLLEILRGSDKE